jgi:hypothetical protein
VPKIKKLNNLKLATKSKNTKSTRGELPFVTQTILKADLRTNERKTLEEKKLQAD